MAIIVSAPDAFFDCEVWEFDLTINEPDGSGPMNLTGSALFVRFMSLADNVEVGTCDTAGADGSLIIVNGPAGLVRLVVPSIGRTWRLPVRAPCALALRSTVIGDLFRRASDGAKPRGIGRIEIGVLPSTGAA